MILGLKEEMDGKARNLEKVGRISYNFSAQSLLKTMARSFSEKDLRDASQSAQKKQTEDKVLSNSALLCSLPHSGSPTWLCPSRTHRA